MFHDVQQACLHGSAVLLRAELGRRVRKVNLAVCRDRDVIGIPYGNAICLRSQFGHHRVRTHGQKPSERVSHNQIAFRVEINPQRTPFRVRPFLRFGAVRVEAHDKTFMSGHVNAALIV
jgi:hypothetical protein